MNKKLLLATMSLAVLAACTNDDDFGSKKVAENASPVQFEVLNNNEALTRASMNGTKISWSATDGDLFTLYHGDVTGTSYQNATYKAEAGDGGVATLTTPSMILPGAAIMVWPVDTAFTNSGAALAISVPENQTADIENNIPYVSDVVTIAAYNKSAAYNTAGYARKYPIYMRPMASQLIIKADYAGTEAKIAELYTGENSIDPIKVASVDIEATTEQFTTKIPLTFTAKSAADGTRWNAAEKNNAWSHVTGFGTASATSAKLTTKCLTGNESAKFLILPQPVIATADNTSAVTVNTIYGKVVVNTADGDKAWYRYTSSSAVLGTGETRAATAEASGDNAGKYKTTALVEDGMMQTLNGFSSYTANSGVVKTEPIGASATRYVKVDLNTLDMDGLHITSDKQLRDAARVWQHIGAATVTVFVDGDDNKEFAISQTTIAAINAINEAAAAEETPREFKVKACKVPGEACETIVITGGGDIPENLSFITWGSADSNKPYIAFNKGESWNWKVNVTIRNAAGAVPLSGFINRGTMNNGETATLAIYNNAATPAQKNIPLENAATGIWNITAGDLTVQFDVKNLGTVNISAGAEYHQDIANATATTFTNEALTVPDRFYQKDPTYTAKQKAEFVEKIGKVNNSGVFAVTGTSTVKGVINNYGRIEHQTASAKTYVTTNQSSGTPAFGTAFGATNKFGLINLPWEIRSSATNVSVSAALAEGFISLTYTGAENTGTLEGNIGGKINYVIVKSGIATIGGLSDNIKYLEIDEEGTEIVFNTSTRAATVTVPALNKFEGLMVLTDVNIEEGVTLNISKATFLAAKMYVGGTFNQGAWTGYYGDTTNNYTSKYITY